MPRYLVFFVLTWLMGACQSSFKPKNPKNNATNARKTDTLFVTQRLHLDYPSASASVRIDSTCWILGDDAPHLLLMKLGAHSAFQEIPLPFERETKKTNDLQKSPSWKKKTKLDFEAFAHYFQRTPELQMHHVWAFGSGSKKTARDTGLYWNFLTTDTQTSKQVYKVNLSPLYEYLQNRSKIPPEQWNIEGACIDIREEGNLYLLQRLPATLIQIPLRDWFRYLEIGSLPQENSVRFKRFNLPKIDGHDAGFSGATYDSLRHSIWFSASVEISKDPVRDGEILGSFLGEISLFTGEVIRTPIAIPEVSNAKEKTKLESLSLLDVTHINERTFVGTVDNDNGSSQILFLRVELQ
jgi:hypothetical protein